MQNSHTEITISHRIVNNNLTNSVAIQPRYTHVPHHWTKFGDDRTLFNVIFDVCGV